MTRLIPIVGELLQQQEFFILFFSSQGLLGPLFPKGFECGLFFMAHSLQLPLVRDTLVLIVLAFTL
jgi:hypothetical protein